MGILYKKIYDILGLLPVDRINKVRYNKTKIKIPDS